MGNSEDINGFKNSNINLNESEFYGNIGNFLKKYTETKELEYKTGIYNVSEILLKEDIIFLLRKRYSLLRKY